MIMKHFFTFLYLPFYLIGLSQTTSPDAVIGNINFQVGCIGDNPAYSIDYTVYNYGSEEITDYCVEIWNEDYYICYSEELFGSYGIPAGEGQSFTSPFFEFTGNPGGFFVMSVDNVNDEVITGNNNTTVYYPSEWPDCPDDCVSDTVEVVTYIYQIDSIFTTIYETIYDTVYVELPQDTVYENVYFYDTTYVEIIDTVLVNNYIYEYITDTILVDNYIYINDTIYLDNYIFITDTVTEIILQELWIDCETGLPCEEQPIGIDCPEWTTVHIPNTFTPNNDGVNDSWMIKYDLNCWEDVEFWIYNRWGDEVYHNYGSYFDSYPFWNGSFKGGTHFVTDGVYTYVVHAKKYDSTEVIKKVGHITIFR